MKANLKRYQNNSMKYSHEPKNNINFQWDILGGGVGVYFGNVQ